jgi:hypothetical protein
MPVMIETIEFPWLHITERPEVKLVKESFKYDYNTTHLYFVWVEVAGHPDRLELQYR